jgi:hypothetical protein
VAEKSVTGQFIKLSSWNFYAGRCNKSILFTRMFMPHHFLVLLAQRVRIQTTIGSQMPRLQSAASTAFMRH